MQLNVVHELSKYAIEFNDYVKSQGGVLLSSYIKSTEKIKIGCKNGHIWWARPGSVKIGHWCPECAGKSSSAAKAKFLKIIQEKGGTALTSYSNNRTKVQIKCSNDHVWDVAPTDIISGHWCQACANKSPFIARERLEYIVETNGPLTGGSCAPFGGVLLTNYINSYEKVTIKCHEGHCWDAIPPAIIYNNSWCPICARNSPIEAEKNFIRTVNEKKGMILGKYVNSNTNVLLQCELGHRWAFAREQLSCSWETTPANIRDSHWCHICAGNSPITARDKMLEIIQKNKGILLDKYINDMTKIRVQCADGHVWLTTPGYIKSGRWCSYCNQSRGERAVMTILNKMGIVFIPQWRHPKLTNRRYDFRFDYNGYQYIIEYDGGQHFESIEFFDKQRTLEERQEIDKLKTHIACGTGYKLIRLDFTLSELDLESHIMTGLTSGESLYVSNMELYKWLISNIDN